MYLFDFHSKLKRLNPLLYIYLECRNRMSAGVFVTGIYLRKSTRNPKAVSADTNYAHQDAKALVNAAAAGDKDTFVTGVSLNHVPEYDVYDYDRERLLIPGWRTILLTLVDKKVVTLDKAKKVFRCSSLGQSDWDLLEFAQRLQWSKGDRPERKFK